MWSWQLELHQLKFSTCRNAAAWICFPQASTSVVSQRSLLNVSKSRSFESATVICILIIRGWSSLTEDFQLQVKFLLCWKVVMEQLGSNVWSQNQSSCHLRVVWGEEWLLGLGVSSHYAIKVTCDRGLRNLFGIHLGMLPFGAAGPGCQKDTGSGSTEDHFY